LEINTSISHPSKYIIYLILCLSAYQWVSPCCWPIGNEKHLSSRRKFAVLSALEKSDSSWNYVSL